MEGVNITREADARGSFCPGPLMEMIRMMRDAEIGDVIAVISKDEGSKKDIPAWIEKASHEFLGAEDFDDGAVKFIARKAR